METPKTVRMVKKRPEGSNEPSTADVAESEIDIWWGWGWTVDVETTGLIDSGAVKRIRKSKAVGD